MKFTNYWKFESDQDKKDTEASILSSKLFINHYIKYLERRESELFKKITEQSLIESTNWEDKLAFIIGEMKGITKEIDHLKNLVDFS